MNNSIKKRDILQISVVLPCLNEERGIVFTLNQIVELLRNTKHEIEVLVVDNGSVDNTIKNSLLYKDKIPNLRIITESIPGYGAAYKKGIIEARGDYIFMCDADGTYGFDDFDSYTVNIKHGSDFVIGNRFAYNFDSCVMPWTHRYIGNPFLTLLVRVLFSVDLKDVHCGKRMVSKRLLNDLCLVSDGMEYASEMVIKAVLKGYKITEIPIEYHARIGNSKLRTLRDGFRHLVCIIKLRMKKK